MTAHGYSIGQLARQASCKVETVHYYEKTGLMPEPPRTEGGHRIYSLVDIKRLNFIRRCRQIGFTIEQVKELLKFIDEPDHYCGEVKAMAMQQIDVVESKIRDLEHLRDALFEMIARCKGGNYTIDDCPIIDALYMSE